MSMRITNSMMIDNSLRNLNGQLRRVSRYNDQLASNRKILKLSDSPVGVLNSLGARQQIRRLQQYQKNVSNAQTWVTQTETSVYEMEQIIITIREKLIDAMGVKNDTDKKVFATEFAELTEELLTMCNSSIGDKYIFAGFNTTNRPFEAVYDTEGNMINVLYNGIDLVEVGMYATPQVELQDISSALDFEWLNAPDMSEYTMRVNGDVITFTDANGNTYDVTIPAPAGTPGSTETIALTDANGKSFGTVSWTNGTVMPTAEQIAASIASVNNGNIPEVATMTNVEWSGELSEKTTYTITAAGNTVTFTDPDGNAYNVTIPTPSGLPGSTESVALVDANGTSFGMVSWTNGEPVPTAEQIATVIANGVSVTTSSIASGYAQPVIGAGGADAVANNGLTWTGYMDDELQKYTMSVEGDTISFTNSYGSVVHTHQVTDADVAAQEIDLTAQGLGVISWTTDPAVDAADPARDTLTEAVAQMIGSAEYVTTKVGEEATQNLQIEIGYQVKFDISYTGLEVVSTGENNMFNVLINLVHDLNAGVENENLSHYLTELSAVQDQLLSCMVKSGTRTTKLDSIVNRYSLDAINYEATRSNIEDIDQAEVIMKMKYSETIYKQALASAAQIIQPTLMDFL